MRALVIDDNEIAAFLLCELVKSRRWESRYSTMADDAIGTAKKWQPNVILLDLIMPRIDGYRLAPMLREASGNGAAPRIILVSGYMPDPARLTQAAIDGYLLKPVRLQQLTELLDSWASGVP